MPAPGSEASFAGTARYRIVRELGQGGMGVVYEVADEVRGEHVALKAIKRSSSDLLYRLKREFRALAELRHPNLVRLHDLVVEGDDGFFTMELVEGAELLQHLRGQGRAESAARSRPEDPAALAATMEATPSDPALSRPVSAAPALSPAREDRLRATLPQLVAGLAALHAHGKVHRDVKPSNVLVTPDGRVVLLDFGLVTAGLGNESSPGGLVGTLAYMAPEQCRGQSVTPAADLYAVGAILYEALSGRLPHEGPALQVLVAKQKEDPPPLPPGVPDDLAALCLALLARDPAARPGAAEVLERLGQAPARQAVPRVLASGRDRELAAMLESLPALERGSASAIVIEGQSGMGKSSLVRAFIERAREAHPGLVVLEGRCYQRESVPYQALDSLIDHLSATWRGLPAGDAASLLPLDVALLARLFPVLGRVPAVAQAGAGKLVDDPQELRRRGFAALREVLVRMGQRWPLVLVLDDLQWGDASTFSLLADVLGPPDPPPLIIVMSTRPEGGARLLELARGLQAAVQHHRLEPLAPAAARELAQALLPAADATLAEHIASEAQGSPFFIAELAAVADGEKPLRIAEVLGDRIAALPAAAATTLTLVALAGQPIGLEVLARALGSGLPAVRQDVEHLVEGRFLRGSLAQVEPFHDRVRDAVLGALPDGERRRLAGQLAQACEDQGEPLQGEQVATPWRMAGNLERAAPHARAAAEQALGRLDFARAAALFRLALECGGWSPAQAAQLEAQYGMALVDAGSTREAAIVLAAAGRKSPPTEALALRRRSAEALVRGGYLAEGTRALRQVMDELGLPLAGSTLGALARYGWWRLRLALRGLRSREVDPEQVPAEARGRLEALWSTASGLMVSDVLSAAHHQARHLYLALQTGAVDHLERALAIEAATLHMRGRHRAGDAVDRRLEAMLERRPDTYVQAMSHVGRALNLMHTDNSWRQATQELDRAESCYRRVTSASYEVAGVRVMRSTCQLFLGELGQLRAQVPALVRDALRRGDQATAAGLRLRLGILHLVKGDSDGALVEVERTLAEWNELAGRYLIQNYWALLSLVDVALYQGVPRQAQALLERDRGPLRRSLIDRVDMTRANMDFAGGRVAVALARQASLKDDVDGARQQRRTVARLAGRLGRRPLPMAQGFAQVLEACFATLEDDRTEAESKLRQALATFERLEMRLHAESVRYRLGELTGDDATSAQAVAWFASQGVVDPARLASVQVPRCQ